MGNLEKARLAILGPIAGAISGCVTMVLVAPAPSPDQTVRYYNGVGLVTSKGQNCSVSFGPLDEIQNQDERTMFLVSVTNRTSAPVLVKPKDLTASAPSLWGKPDQLTVIDRIARITEVEQQRASARFAAVMVGVSAAVQSAQPAVQTGSVGGMPYTATTTNPAVAAQAQQQGLANSLAISQAADANYAAAMARRTGFMATNTIMPGETYNAFVAIELPYVGSVPAIATFRLDACGETHTFQATYTTRTEPAGNN